MWQHPAAYTVLAKMNGQVSLHSNNSPSTSTFRVVHNAHDRMYFLHAIIQDLNVINLN